MYLRPSFKKTNIQIVSNSISGFRRSRLSWGQSTDGPEGVWGGQNTDGPAGVGGGQNADGPAGGWGGPSGYDGTGRRC